MQRLDAVHESGVGQQALESGVHDVREPSTARGATGRGRPRSPVDGRDARQRRLGLSADTVVRSCYEAGRDGFWLHRALAGAGSLNVVVDPSSIVGGPARPARQDRSDRRDRVGHPVDARHGRRSPRLARVARAVGPGRSGSPAAGNGRRCVRIDAHSQSHPGLLSTQGVSAAADAPVHAAAGPGPQWRRQADAGELLRG